MAIFLKENFNENCYMSCALLLSKSSIYDQFQANFNLFNFEIFLDTFDYFNWFWATDYNGKIFTI